MTGLIGLLIFLVVVGVILYVLNSLIPIDARIMKLIGVVIVLIVIFWLLQAFGLMSGVVRLK